MDALVLYLFENDIAETTPEECTKKICKVANDIKEKFEEAKRMKGLTEKSVK